MQTYVLHDADLDGMGAKYAAWYKLRGDAEYIELDHEEDREHPPWDALPSEPARVFVLDYSWDLDQLFELASRHTLTVIDHHDTLFDALSERGVGLHVDTTMDFEGRRAFGRIGQLTQEQPDRTDSTFEVQLDLDRSAACLAWMYFHQTEPPRLLKHIEDRDLWNWEMENTDEVLKGLEAKGVDMTTINTHAENIGRLIPTGKAVCAYRDGLVEPMADNAVIKDLDLANGSYTAAITGASVLYSRVGDRLLQETDAEIAVMLRLLDPPSDRVRLSLRALDEGPDVGQIAEFYDGAGMENAAGCAMPLSEVTETNNS